MANSVFWKKVPSEKYGFINMPHAVCPVCNKVYTNGNVYASDHCPECAEEIAKAKNRERVRKYRAKKRAEAEAGL
ncbi:hypothetical protein [Parasporobacterium paucivorans]|uniref:Uncharacterized protein n=1 Tax=Parasporobacterium paucivorans DSM 15970 TaxID=1122934 RepID=A0A1M6F335_9FIRM|nr:hypothetical protein [Parasporobacterium paucivorans]SHI92081.1 hypothetical protein SAMN02745691_01037 [Parasporobacterium paucivorans DSM 15970]